MKWATPWSLASPGPFLLLGWQRLASHSPPECFLLAALRSQGPAGHAGTWSSVEKAGGQVGPTGRHVRASRCPRVGRAVQPGPRREVRGRGRAVTGVGDRGGPAQVRQAGVILSPGSAGSKEQTEPPQAESARQGEVRIRPVQQLLASGNEHSPVRHGRTSPGLRIRVGTATAEQREAAGPWGRRGPRVGVSGGGRSCRSSPGGWRSAGKASQEGSWSAACLGLKILRLRSEGAPERKFLSEIIYGNAGSL